MKRFVSRVLVVFVLSLQSFAQTSDTLVHYDTVVGLAASYNLDDRYRVGLVATREGNIHEFYYKDVQNGLPVNIRQSLIGNFKDILGIAGFYAKDDNYRIAVVATGDGNIHEIFYHPHKGKWQSIIAHFEGILGIAAFYNDDDHYRVILVATKSGDIHEVFYHPQKGKGQSVLAHYDNIMAIAGQFDKGTTYRTLLVSTSNGKTHVLLYHPTKGRHESTIDRILGTTTSIALNNNRIFTVSSEGVLSWNVFQLENYKIQVTSSGYRTIDLIKYVAVDHHDATNPIYSTSDGNVHKLLYTPPPQPPPPTPTPTPQEKEATYTFYLKRQQIFEGPIPYAAVFPELPINGKLIGFKNPNAYSIGLITAGHSSAECFTNPKATVALPPNGSTKFDDIKLIYGTSTPTLPVTVIACVNTGTTVLNLVPLNVTYTYK